MYMPFTRLIPLLLTYGTVVNADTIEVRARATHRTSVKLKDRLIVVLGCDGGAGLVYKYK